MRFVLNALLKSAKGKLRRLRPETHRQSSWSGYAVSNESYKSEELKLKEDFVTEVLRGLSPEQGVGCRLQHGPPSALPRRRPEQGW